MSLTFPQKMFSSGGFFIFLYISIILFKSLTYFSILTLASDFITTINLSHCFCAFASHELRGARTGQNAGSCVNENRRKVGLPGFRWRKVENVILDGAVPLG